MCVRVRAVPTSELGYLRVASLEYTTVPSSRNTSNVFILRGEAGKGQASGADSAKICTENTER
jgi:hypothetical protein